MLRYLSTLTDAVALRALVKPAHKLCFLLLAQLLVLAGGEAARIRVEGCLGGADGPLTGAIVG